MIKIKAKLGTDEKGNSGIKTEIKLKGGHYCLELLYLIDSLIDQLAQNTIQTRDDVIKDIKKLKGIEEEK